MDVVSRAAGCELVVESWPFIGYFKKGISALVIFKANLFWVELICCLSLHYSRDLIPKLDPTGLVGTPGFIWTLRNHVSVWVGFRRLTFWPVCLLLCVRHIRKTLHSLNCIMLGSGSDMNLNEFGSDCVCRLLIRQNKTFINVALFIL